MPEANQSVAADRPDQATEQKPPAIRPMTFLN